MKKPRLIVIGPLPPPMHGVAISTSLVLRNPLLREKFEVRHLDTSDRRPISNIGRWDLGNVALGLGAVRRLLALLGAKSGVVYLPLSQGVPALLRDSLFIHLTALRGWKVAAHLRGSEFRDVYTRSGFALRLWLALTLRRIDSIAVMGESLRVIFEGLVPAERIVVVPNGTPEPQPNGAVRDPHTVLFLSNLRRRKGVIEAVEAALLVLREDPDARFLFVGEWEESTLERALRARAAEADGRISFRPSVETEQKDQLLGSAGILLFPPRAPEGHPRVVLEGLAAGLPVVTTDSGTIAETVGDAGFVLQHPAPGALADRIVALLRDDALREEIGAAARQRYLDRFTQDQADCRLADWLEEVAGR